MFKCKECDFESFNEKALNQHIDEEHYQPIPKETVLKEERGRYTVNNGRTKEHQDSIIKKANKNFAVHLKGKKVECETIRGGIHRGILIDLNFYELLLDENGQEVILFKHSLVSLKGFGCNIKDKLK